jgi:hypothetical protein
MHVTRSRWIYSLILIGVLAVATALRVIDFPARYSIRDMDETGYCQGSLQLIEGITPGNKAAPGGPLIWAGWVCLAGETAWDLANPLPSERRESLAVRPFSALDRVLFDNCRDVSSLRRVLVLLVVVLSIAATAAAVGLGLRLGGAIGGLLLGGLFAVAPPLLDLSEMCRPYSMAWSFGMLSLYFASFSNRSNRRWWMYSAICLGLSIGSRIEMLCLIPIVWWVFSIATREVVRGTTDQSRRVGFAHRWAEPTLLTLFSLCIATWVAPWLMTHLIGNLRTIATVRFSGVASPGVGEAVMDCFYRQGIGPVMLLGVIAIFFQPAGAKLRLIAPVIYTLVLSISMLMGYADGIHQHGAVLIGWFVILAVGIGPMFSRWPREMGIVLALVLVFPLVQAVRQIRFAQSLEDHEDSVAWIEQHVPAGITVYLIEGGERSLLPTPAASSALWSEVTDDQAWRKKMESGLSRFKLSADELPRALSEENLIQERANRRKWFILGGHIDLPIPRYDVKVVVSSPVFGVRDLDAAMKSQGGVLIWRDGFHVDPPAFLGPPVMQWISKFGTGVRVYCSPELRSRITNSKNETSKRSNE